MSHLARTVTAGLLSTAIAGAAYAQASQVETPVQPNPPKPGVQVQAPGVNIQTPAPGAAVQTPGVRIQAPGVNLQVPIARAQIGVPAGASDDGIGEAGYYSRNPWFSNPSVREELKLNDDQYNALNRKYESAWVEYNKNRTVVDSSLSLQKQAQREAALRQSFNKQFSPAVDATITDQVARDRYYQLHNQYRGYSAFQDPAIQQELNLTPEQQQKLDQYNADWAKQTANWRTDYPAKRETVAKQMREARQAARKNIDNTLTPAQRARWNAITGQPYEFHSDVYFPGQTTPTTTLKPINP